MLKAGWEAKMKFDAFPPLLSCQRTEPQTTNSFNKHSMLHNPKQDEGLELALICDLF